MLTIARRCGIFVLFLVLTGCATPTFVTKYRSNEASSEPVRELALIVVQGRFPHSMTAGHQFGDASWYQGVGERIEQNFHHNGIRLGAANGDGRYAVEGVPTLSKDKPTLVLHANELFLRNYIPWDLLFQARLWVPGRKTPVWEGVTIVSIHRAADELSLKLINELEKQGFLVPTRVPAETLDGKKHSTLGGVLTQ